MNYFIFDTDMGNDIDDAFALIMIASAHAKKDATLALTVSSNPNPLSVAMIKSVNTYYGAGDTPLAINKGQLKYAWDNNGFCKAAADSAGLDCASVKAEDGVNALRKTLAALPDASVRVVATGFSTNLAGLLRSESNFNNDGIKLNGIELVKRKVQFLSIMAADFHQSMKDKDGNLKAEFNVDGDIPAMKEVMDSWPSPIYISDFSIGLKVCVDWQRLDKQLKDSNPLKVAYKAFYKGDPGSRQSWDQTSMLFALEPDAGHFKLSEEGRVEILESGLSVFHPQKGANCRLLLFDETRTPERINETLHSKYYLESIAR